MTTEMTAIEAMDICIRKWDWCAKTGRRKPDWPEWERNGGTVPYMHSFCPLCQYTINKVGKLRCTHCPMYRHWGIGETERDRCDDGGRTLYMAWLYSLEEHDPAVPKAAATALVARLREVRAGMDTE